MFDRTRLYNCPYSCAHLVQTMCVCGRLYPSSCVRLPTSGSAGGPGRADSGFTPSVKQAYISVRACRSRARVWYTQRRQLNMRSTPTWKSCALHSRQRP